MAKTLPGTTIAVDWNRPEEAETLLNSLFLAGGLMLSQVASLTGLEPYVIQNWVRRGFVAPPERKRYTRRQFSRIVLINMLKDSMQLDKICALLSYVNGELDDESDDLIDDFLRAGDYRIVAEEGEADDEVKTVADFDDEDDLVTEELAEIYRQQGLNDEACAIYRKLSLRNPEKSVYFAELIDEIASEGKNR